jgi:hypothetical protein
MTISRNNIDDFLRWKKRLALFQLIVEDSLRCIDKKGESVFPMSYPRLSLAFVLAAILFADFTFGQQSKPKPVPYLQLTQPRHVLPDAQPWEGNEFPHTMSVLEMNRDNFRYWGWYGLNEGRGIGLARSNDLIHWIKYDKNPLWSNARWPSVLLKADPKNADVLYFAITRNYDTPSSYIVLASSRDGLQLKEEKILVSAVSGQRNQNPNLFQDPSSGRFYLTYYRGNDKDQFEIVSRHASSIQDLDKSPEKILLHSTDTVAAPTLLFLKNKKYPSGVYFLATEVYPHRYTTDPEGEWQVKLFAADSPDGSFQPVAGNPILKGQRACLFQHVFNNRFYGYDCHLEANDKWVLEEVEASLE